MNPGGQGAYGKDNIHEPSKLQNVCCCAHVNKWDDVFISVLLSRVLPLSRVLNLCAL